MPIGLDGQPNPQLVVPQLFEDYFPGWFAGVAFAAIAIGALVPAAIMSIAAANLFTRNIYREWLRPHAGPADEARVSKIVSLVVKSTSSCSVASGSCRRSRPSCSGSTLAGSTATRCWPGGPRRCCTAQ
jgi:Na+/proline symporter